jgi:hypothetical protein
MVECSGQLFPGVGDRVAISLYSVFYSGRKLCYAGNLTVNNETVC